MPFMMAHRRNQVNSEPRRLVVTDGPFTETKELIGRDGDRELEDSLERGRENGNMSRTIGSLAHRSLAEAGIIAAAVLTAPAAAHAQTTPERALLNRLAPTAFVSTALPSGSAEFPAESGAVNGERALLGARTPVPHERNPETVDAGVASIWVNGSYALLGRVELADHQTPERSRRIGVAR